MSADKVRRQFIDFFVKHGHREVPSSRVVPENDPTLLFTNAGMNQFKNVFLGLESRAYQRAVTSQKCIRAGGKHNDLENVGFTARHHTFFEMLGNFSFGDYFKKDAIHLAWELVTKDFGLDKDRLYVSVFESDEEAADLWHKQEGVPRERIYKFGESSNFWRMGDSGPCGPCSEIFYDQGEEVEGDPKDNVMGGDGDRFIEIWNLVFMQFHEDGKGGRVLLPKPSVDTGMGLERLASVVQGELSNYHTTEMLEIISAAEKVCGRPYQKNLKSLVGERLQKQKDDNVAFRVLADHARAAAFMMADGVMPSNEGRGYVLRRILRRAIRYGRNLSSQSIFPEVVKKVIAVMKNPYPELGEAASAIISRTTDEQDRFLKTLESGIGLLEDEFKKLNSRNLRLVAGEVAFKLYDTFGFPLDLTRLMARERGFGLDETGFDRLMQKSKEQARSSWKAKSVPSDVQHLIGLTKDVYKKTGPTVFTGYAQTEGSAQVVRLSDGKQEVASLKDSGLVILNKTCFYAESGGQVGDTGRLIGTHVSADVLGTTKIDEVFVHHIKVSDGELLRDQELHLLVDRSQRLLTANNHSATHLLHAALRIVLGESVGQAGSLVDHQKLRFDFTFNRPLTREEISRIENIVNNEIAMDSKVVTEEMSLDEAKKSGAIAMFGEKYADKVRVLSVGPSSKELCGGTHVQSTAQIRLFKIVSETGVSSGVRRLEAITADRALEYLNKLSSENLSVRESIGAQESWVSILENENLVSIQSYLDKQKEMTRDLQKKIQSLASGSVDLEKILATSVGFGRQSRLILADLDLEDRNLLSHLSDKLRDKIQTGIIVLVGKGQSIHPVIVTVTKDLMAQFSAAQILKDLATVLGGKGGGRADFAQGSVPDRGQLHEAFLQIQKRIVG